MVAHIQVVREADDLGIAHVCPVEKGAEEQYGEYGDEADGAS